MPNVGFFVFLLLIDGHEQTHLPKTNQFVNIQHDKVV